MKTVSPVVGLTVEVLLAPVYDWDPSFEGPDRPGLELDERTGFIKVVDHVLAARGITRYLGFGVPTDSEGEFDTSNEVTPLTRFSDVPNWLLGAQFKGVGPRMWNGVLGLTAMAERPEFGRVGVYTFDVRTGLDTFEDADIDKQSRLLDHREAQGGRFKQFFSHAWRRLRATYEPPSQVIEEIHESYGDAQAVLFKVPLRGALRQAIAGVSKEDRDVSQFMIIRDPAVTLRRVGTASMSQRKRPAAIAA